MSAQRNKANAELILAYLQMMAEVVHANRIAAANNQHSHLLNYAAAGPFYNQLQLQSTNETQSAQSLFAFSSASAQPSQLDARDVFASPLKAKIKRRARYDVNAEDECSRSDIESEDSNTRLL